MFLANHNLRASQRIFVCNGKSYFINDYIFCVQNTTELIIKQKDECANHNREMEIDDDWSSSDYCLNFNSIAIYFKLITIFSKMRSCWVVSSKSPKMGVSSKSAKVDKRASISDELQKFWKIQKNKMKGLENSYMLINKIIKIFE